MSRPHWPFDDWSNGRWRGDRQRKGKRFDLFVRWSWSGINVPRLSGDWSDDDEVYLSLDYGNGNSDPVVGVSVTVRRPPRWLAGLVEWVRR